MKNYNLQNGSKSTNHREERDLLTPLNSFYSFSKTSATLIDGSENATVGGDLNFRFHMVLKGAVTKGNGVSASVSFEIGFRILGQV